MGGIVIAVSRDAAHAFIKPVQDGIQLLAEPGVEGDAHLGVKVQHLSRVALDPIQANRRQVHLIDDELHRELRAAGFSVSAGEMGEIITTHGIDLLALPAGTRLHLAKGALIEVIGLRNPCRQLDRFQDGLMAGVLGRDEQGRLNRKAGIMGVIRTSGLVCPGDAISIELPPRPHKALQTV
jgi:MOSC domain-containing protein YiiM